MTNEEEHMPFDYESGPFGLPESYFQKSARSVFTKVEWLEEHKDFPVLVKLQPQKGFTVPGNYFSGSEQKLELLAYPALSASRKQDVFTVPFGFFEVLERKALLKLRNEEEQVLGAIPKINAFQAPETYFFENERRLKASLLKEQQPARVIRLFGPKAWMAAAALLLLALGAWLYNSYTAPVAGVKDCGSIACLDKKDLLKSRSLESLETDELYDLVNSKKLEEKLDGEPKGTNRIKKSDSLNDEQADELLDGI